MRGFKCLDFHGSEIFGVYEFWIFLAFGNGSNK